MNLEQPRVQPTILIVDDQPVTILMLKEAIRELGNVYFATSGELALAKAESLLPDLILLDVEMPGMSGYAVCQALRSHPKLQYTSVIFVTSHGSDERELQALDLGGVDFLHKPVNVPLARARIQNHLTLQLRTKQLAMARQSLEEFVQHLPAFVAHWDGLLRNDLCNDVEGRWFGVTAAEMRGQLLGDVLGTSNFLAMAPHIQRVQAGASPSFDIMLSRKQGDTLHGQVSLVGHTKAGFDAGFLMLITDVTERKRAELALFDEKERIRIALNSIGDAVITTDEVGKVTFLNPIAETMTGWLNGEAVGMPIEQVMPLRDGPSRQAALNPVRLALSEGRTVGMALNCTLTHRNGQSFDVEDSCAPIRNHSGEIVGAIVVFHDVSEARAMAIKMTHLANHDALTDLPNRMLLQDRTEQALHQADRGDGKVAMLFLDLDHFKLINDSAGHQLGDRLLREVAKRLKEAIRIGDTISRQGGDEFIILCTEISDVAEASLLAERLLKAVNQPFLLNGERYDLTTSIGISIYPDDSLDSDSLFSHADAAMYQAKHEGRGRVRYYSREIEDALYAKHMLERHMRLALEDGAFEVHYQPQVEGRTRLIAGVEALVRWRNAEGALISPAQFIPIAEETGLIVPLGRHILRQACLQAKAWYEAGFPISVAVNVSAKQIEEPSFADYVREVLSEVGVQPGLIELEITEGVLAKDVLRTLATIGELKALGLRIAIDDFGTGYSSLAYLKQFPLDVLKIDQSFVREMLADKSSAAIVAAVVNMAKALDLQLVAEGVETVDQEAHLLSLGCEIMQGYFYARPLPAVDVSVLLGEGLQIR